VIGPPNHPVRPLDIAVIGTGISGMAAAWLLNSAHRVSVYESDSRLGGHANTVEVPIRSDFMPVDTGFIVYNETNYPNLVQLFRALEVATEPSDMSFAVSIGDGALEYSGTSLAGLIAQKRNLVRPRFWRMVADTLRFYRAARALLASGDPTDITLGAFLRQGDYSAGFLDDHLLPMGAAIWSTPVAEMLDFPLLSFARFLETPKSRKGSGEPEVGQWPVSTQLDRPVQPHDCFVFATGTKLRRSHEQHPAGRPNVPWADAQRFEYVSLGLLVVACEKLRRADPRVGGRQISVDRQSALALRYALGGAICVHAQDSQCTMGVGMVRAQFEDLAQP